MAVTRNDTPIGRAACCTIIIIILGMNVVQNLAKQKMAVYVMPDVYIRQFSDGMHLLNVVISQ